MYLTKYFVDVDMCRHAFAKRKTKEVGQLNKIELSTIVFDTICFENML